MISTHSGPQWTFKAVIYLSHGDRCPYDVTASISLACVGLLEAPQPSSPTGAAL